MKYIPVAPYNVNIETAANGYIVTVGCQRFVAESLEEMIDGISDYFLNPEEAIREWAEATGLEASGPEPQPEPPHLNSLGAAHPLET